MATHRLEQDRHHELAAFLRSRRARLLPEQVGLPRGTRRRTPGLRREEVALLAGASPEWYTWLEQGRDINVSMQMLESLARALRLDATERDHLFLLAVRQPPPVETFSPPCISPTVQHFLDQLALAPASALDARLNLVTCNQAHHVVFGYQTAATERDRNLIWRLFSPPAQQRNDEWNKLARVYLAQFRANYGRFINDPWWAELIADLHQVSADFRALWSYQDVQNVSEGRKTLRHPVVGELAFDFVWLKTADAEDLRLLIHTPRSGTDTADKIARLLRGEA